MHLPTELYIRQLMTWPQTGSHVLASYDDHSIIVYQAYRPSIGRFAAEHGYLGGPDFSLSRMSWIKPNFLWMMYRSGWGTKPDQEITLGLRIRRTFFDEILRQSVASSFPVEGFKDHDSWKLAVRNSEIRRQWDPDHSPSGAAQERRAIQLGLRGHMLERLSRAELLEVIDLTTFVSVQRDNLHSKGIDALVIPTERVYEATVGTP